jgi:hypothetical protein
MTRFRDCLLFAVLMSLISTGALAQGNTEAGTQADSKSGWFSGWSREDKALALNLGVGAAVLGGASPTGIMARAVRVFRVRAGSTVKRTRAGLTSWGTSTRPICSATCSPASTNAGISIMTRQSGGGHCPPWE